MAALVGSVGWALLRRPEPLYNHKTLSAWLAEYVDERSAFVYSYGIQADFTQHQSEARTAMREIGTNAIPVLLRMARAKDSPLKVSIIALLRKQSLVQVHFRTAEYYRDMACNGFQALGPIGRDAVPALIDQLKARDPETSGTAADCLGHIGPEAKAAVPVLISLLDAPDRLTRWDATVNLGKIHMAPELVVPALMKNLTRSNAILPTTISTLGAFGEHAKPAVPLLVQLFDHENEFVRCEVTNAINKIEAGTGTKPEVR